MLFKLNDTNKVIDITGLVRDESNGFLTMINYDTNEIEFMFKTL